MFKDYGEEITDEEPKQQEPQEQKDIDLLKMAQDDFYNDPVDNSFFG